MALHKDLGNAELHETKGVAAANDQELYWADGIGSGDWAPLVATGGSWTHSSDVNEVEFTGLGDFGLLQVDCSGITIETGTDQYVYIQLGNDSGYTTSAVYYNTYWSSNQENTDSLTGLPLAYYRNSTPANSLVNFASCFITNFNRGKVTVATSQEAFDSSTTTSNGFTNRTHWIREAKAYNKLRVRTTDNMTGGTIIVSGYRWVA